MTDLLVIHMSTYGCLLRTINTVYDNVWLMCLHIFISAISTGGCWVLVALSSKLWGLNIRNTPGKCTMCKIWFAICIACLLFLENNQTLAIAATLKTLTSVLNTSFSHRFSRDVIPVLIGREAPPFVAYVTLTSIFPAILQNWKKHAHINH